MDPSGITPIRAQWRTRRDGIIYLSRDWHLPVPPELILFPETESLDSVKPVPSSDFLHGNAYCHDEESVVFFLSKREIEGWNGESRSFYVAGDFNGWERAVADDKWKLEPTQENGGGWMLRLAFSALPEGVLRFKFVSHRHEWVQVPDDAENAVTDDGWIRNRLYDPARRGRDRFTFHTDIDVDFQTAHYIGFDGQPKDTAVIVWPEDEFYQLQSDLPQGALCEKESTVFRVFAPRATKVWVKVFEQRGHERTAKRIEMERRDAGDWETRVTGNLHGWYYWFYADGESSPLSHFDPEFPILDPYARATCGRAGPGIVVDPSRINGPAPIPFKTPHWHDLVILEGHVRDLTANAPAKMTQEERFGFKGLQKWVEHRDFYPSRLGINALELQPIQEFDNEDRTEYHWGYMTVNFFSPESSYASDPENGSQIRELQELVDACHRREIAVILDVVYNHTGVPSHLLHLDKLYYFHLDGEGNLMNWSGVGNDLRCEAAMSKALIIDSLTYILRTFGVDGFRFDLAELIGFEVLREIETALKEVKDDVILIAEPWSFRGHLGPALKHTGFASWNDGYRDFLGAYVRAHGNQDGIRYFISGSHDVASWPAQTVNYTQSHDDRTWIDRITEHEHFDGSRPGYHDRRRTHLMVAILFSSLGIPMLASGQDFYHSKGGVSNTYQMGDLNALDYDRLKKYRKLHAYCRNWIAFRQSSYGLLFRRSDMPPNSYFRFFFTDGYSSFAVLVNADESAGKQQILFAVNPHQEEVVIEVSEAIEPSMAQWRPRADEHRFFGRRRMVDKRLRGNSIHLEALSCGLWVRELP